MNIDYSKKLALYFDRLRKLRKLSQETFVLDIISIRQYRRYLRGECELTQAVINALAKRLGFKPEYVIVDFEQERSQEMDRLVAFYNAIANYDYTLATTLQNALPRLEDIHEEGKWIYSHALLAKDLQQGKINEATFIEHVKSHSNYEDIIHKDIFSSIEVAFISSLLDMKTFHDKERLVKKLESFLSKESHIIHGNNPSIFLICYYRLAKYAGINKDFTKVISLCDEALRIAKKHQLYYLMDYFYYFKSLGYHRLGNTQLRDYCLTMLYTILISQENPSKFNKFSNLVKQDYQLDLQTHALALLPTL